MIAKGLDFLESKRFVGVLTAEYDGFQFTYFPGE